MVCSSKRVPTNLATERVSNSPTTAISTAYVIRKREYCYEEGSFRGAFPDSCEKRLPASKHRRPMHPHRPSRVLSPCFQHFLKFARGIVTRVRVSVTAMCLLLKVGRVRRAINDAGHGSSIFLHNCQLFVRSNKA